MDTGRLMLPSSTSQIVMVQCAMRGTSTLKGIIIDEHTQKHRQHNSLAQDTQGCIVQR
jgi:hypothetical protein